MGHDIPDKFINEIGFKILKHINNIQTQNNITQNNTFNILAFGKEDLSHITDDTYKKIINKGFKSVPALVDAIHFNKDKPENHNIYISNIRDDYILVF